ncbi:protein FAM227B-like [Rhopilema esculentum]|uniref:protein FAM227B-like n=1 Tax=Rhopilema esculentum TaxID=499914 RepID=UPI0031DE5D9A
MMYGLNDRKRLSRKSRENERPNLPVKTADEWFERENLRTWPIPLASEEELDISNTNHQIKTKDKLMEDLKTHASFDINVLDTLLEKVKMLENSVYKYASQVLENKENSSVEESIKDDEEETYCETMHAKSLPSWQTKQSEVFIGSKNRGVEHTSFPGFRFNELTPLPGSLEAPQLLNRVTNIQNFHGSFKKIWKKYFLSDATVAIFQDTFWWWFLDRYQTDAESQALLFNRLADSFVGLFLAISTTEKDLFFQKFSDCLAQALYSAFCASFPMSFKLFNDEFRKDLLDMISEWFTGIRPPPGSWKSWNLDLLENDQIKSLQDDRAHQLKSSLSFDQENFLDFDQHEQNMERQVTFASASPAKAKYTVKESHQAGPGPGFQRVSFNLHGKSPLISHFLAANRLQCEKPSQVNKLVTRTEIENFPKPFPTYHELIMERKKEARISRKKYSSAMRRSIEERQRINAPRPTDVTLGVDNLQSEKEASITTEPGSDEEENALLQTNTTVEAPALLDTEDSDWLKEDTWREEPMPSLP